MAAFAMIRDYQHSNHTELASILPRWTYTLPGIEHILATGTLQEGTRWGKVQCHDEIRGTAAGQTDAKGSIPPKRPCWSWPVSGAILLASHSHTAYQAGG